MKSPRREKRCKPSPQLLAKVAKLAKIPRTCVKCGRTWENQPTTNPHRLFHHPTCRKYLWRHGVDSIEFTPIRLEAEQTERAFEKELAAHRDRLRAKSQGMDA